MRVTTKIVFDADGNVLEHEFYEYTGPVARCCGPSSQMKQINQQVQSFATNQIDNAAQIFGDASQIFNTLNGAYSKIIAGGPSQEGWSAAESNAVNSQIIDQAAVSARNEKAAAGNAISAIGGGNTVSPSGLATAVTLSTNQAVEQAKAQQLENATIANYQAGNQNFWNASTREGQLPNVFNPATDAAKVAQGALSTAETSQAAIDKANAWWQPLALGAVSAGESFLTGGLSNLGSGESAGEGLSDFMQGGINNVSSKNS